MIKKTFSNQLIKFPSKRNISLQKIPLKREIELEVSKSTISYNLPIDIEDILKYPSLDIFEDDRYKEQISNEKLFEVIAFKIYKK